MDTDTDTVVDKDKDVVGLYRRHAIAWAARRGASARLEAPWLERLDALLPRRARVLDLGCGSGQPIASWLAGRGHAVTGVDTSPTLLAIARLALPGHRFVAGDMRGLALGERFDAVVAWDSAFHLPPDAQRALFPVFADHAAPGAALLFTSGPAAGVSMGRLEGEPLYHASLDATEYRDLLASHGFEVVAHVAEDPACGGHTVWLARRA